MVALCVSKDKIKNVEGHKWVSGKFNKLIDNVAVESPLEICVSEVKSSVVRPISITMRTPGDDAELAMGFLHGEGLFSELNPHDLQQIEVDVFEEENRVLVHIPECINVDEEYLTRNFYTTSSCGVCGKSSINALLLTVPPTSLISKEKIKPDLINTLKQKMQNQQSDFEATGGTHASAIFNSAGDLMHFAEDVGRHNAMDKVIGSAIVAGNLSEVDIVYFSGRTSFELVQKSAMAGISTIVCIGAPSSLAIDLANSFDMLLIGFHRNSQFNVYSAYERIFVTKD